MDRNNVERRASQIHKYLVLMGERQKQTGNKVFLIFNEAAPKGRRSSIVPGMQRVARSPRSDEKHDRTARRQWQVPDTAFRFVDGPLFDQLQAGFSDDLDYSYEIDSPNVICTEDDEDFKWPKAAKQAANFWVVVIDYHD